MLALMPGTLGKHDEKKDLRKTIGTLGVFAVIGAFAAPASASGERLNPELNVRPGQRVTTVLTKRPTSHLTITLQLAQDYESSSDAVVVRHYRVTSSHGKVLLAFVWPHAYYTGNGSQTTPRPFRAGEIVDLDVLNANYERLAFAIVTIK